MADAIRLVIVDDHTLFRKGLVGLLREEPDFNIIGEAGSGSLALQICQQTRPHVVLMDVHMPDGDGIQTVESLKQMMDVRVLMLTVSDKDEDLMGALAAGADGYLLKNADPEDLAQAIRRVAAGQSVLSPEVTARVMKAASRPRLSIKILSQRERDVLQRVAQGATTAEIAADLVISENTVKTHVHRVLKKLGVTNRTAAVAIASRQGLISVE